MITFMHPEVLWLLAALPLFALLKSRRGASCTVRYSSVEIVRPIAGYRKSKAGSWLFSLRAAALALLIVAVARPQWIRASTDVEASGVDIVLAVDASSSMEALDFGIDRKSVSRIDVVRSVVAQFVKERPNDRIGLMAFAGRPYMLSPLTLDHNWVLKRLEQLKVGLVEDGTAIGSAIAASTNRLRDQDAKSKIVILLTDGVNNSGKISPNTAAEAAEALGIKVYTIGAGSDGEAAVPVVDAFGTKHLVRAKVDLDEETLRQVAQATNAKYFRATDADSLKRIYEEINALETTTRTTKRYQHPGELFGWCAVLALLILTGELSLAQTRYRRLPV